MSASRARKAVLLSSDLPYLPDRRQADFAAVNPMAGNRLEIQQMHMSQHTTAQSGSGSDPRHTL
jgi:hypothetical protein